MCNVGFDTSHPGYHFLSYSVTLFKILKQMNDSQRRISDILFCLKSCENADTAFCIVADDMFGHITFSYVTKVRIEHISYSCVTYIWTLHIFICDNEISPNH